jgi:hypothetical protein
MNIKAGFISDAIAQLDNDPEAFIVPAFTLVFLLYVVGVFISGSKKFSILDNVGHEAIRSVFARSLCWYHSPRTIKGTIVLDKYIPVGKRGYICTNQNRRNP